MKKIYKYPLSEGVNNEIMGYTYFVPLSIQVQDGEVVLWAEVDVYTPEKEYKIYCYGTGWPINETALIYIGTAQAGEFVWHYYIKQL